MTTIEDFIKVREPLFSEHPESHPDYAQVKKDFLDHQTEETRQAMRDMAALLTQWNSVDEALPEDSTTPVLIRGTFQHNNESLPFVAVSRWTGVWRGGYTDVTEPKHTVTEWRQIEFK